MCSYFVDFAEILQKRHLNATPNSNTMDAEYQVCNSTSDDLTNPTIEHEVSPDQTAVEGNKKSAENMITCSSHVSVLSEAGDGQTEEEMANVDCVKVEANKTALDPILDPTLIVNIEAENNSGTGVQQKEEDKTEDASIIANDPTGVSNLNTEAPVLGTTTSSSALTPSEKLTDEYHYVKSGGYTCEMFKVVVQNIPPRVTYGQFRQKMSEILGFTPKKTKYNTMNCYAFLALIDEEQRQTTMTALDGYEWKSRTLLCKKAGPAKDPFVRETKRKAADEKYKSKKAKHEEQEGLTPEERIVKAVCPYASKTYDEQLKLKEADMIECIEKLTGNFKFNYVGKSWLKERSDGRCLELLPIVKSPVLTHYRNKVEFSIGVGPTEKDNTVGFRLASYKEGSLLIVEPSGCINCSKPSLQLAKLFQDFIQSLPYPSYNVGVHIGFWQQLTVRTCSTNDVMAIIQLNKSYFTEETEYMELVKKLQDFFADETQPLKVTSAYISRSSQKNNNIDIFEHIHGSKHITENLGKLTFRISPDAFFQVNTPAADMLYSIVRDWCDLDLEDTVVLDVCCGTGTIGLTIAKDNPLPVIGVEISEQAVEDAKYNAAFNDIENCKFICGPAEVVLHKEIKNLRNKNIVAIVDPPRAGLHKNVLYTLRACPAIKKIIYVACSPKQASDNFLGFCRSESKRYKGRPFRTVRAVPVDLFPQTPHCELIVQLERVT